MRSHTGDLLAKHPQQACPTPGTRGRNSAIHLDNWGVLGKGGSRAVTSPGVTGSMWRGMGTGYRTRDVITLAAPCMYPTQLNGRTYDKGTSDKTWLRARDESRRQSGQMPCSDSQVQAAGGHLKG